MSIGPLELFVVLVLIGIPAAAIAALARHYGRSTAGFFVFGLLFWPLALVVVLLMGRPAKPQPRA